MTDTDKQKLLDRATPEYARAYLDSLGDLEQPYSEEDILIEFVKEVIQPRENQKAKSTHH